MLEIAELDKAFAAAIWPDAPEREKGVLLRLMKASREGHLCIRETGFFSFPEGVVCDADRIYLQRNWALETAIVEQLRRLLAVKPDDLFDPARWSVSDKLQERQAEAVRHALMHSVTVVSGGPGTGKTFTAREMIATLGAAVRHAPLRIKIAAPTGKAADRLFQGLEKSEKWEVEALTLHRLLRLRPGRQRLFEAKEIEADLILVDEASMIDASLFAHLLSATPGGARLVLLGDADQLPPIGGGSIFRELPAIRLESSYRTQDGGLQSLFEAVKRGDAEPLLKILEPLDERMLEWPKTHFDKRPDPLELFEQFDRSRVISPLRRGPLGVDALNAKAMRGLQREGWWAAPMLLTENDPGLQLYNGTPAVLIGQAGKERAYFADGRSFSLSQLPGYEMAFALSAHKSQGSEYGEVICWLPPGSEEFGKEALYTAMTRARGSLRLKGDPETLRKMVERRTNQESGFRERFSTGKNNH